MTDSIARLTSALTERYHVERELGAGGMATVYLARDVKHRRQVAVKVLKPELAAVIGAERFLQEIHVTAHLQHPHILPLFDSGEADSFLFYVMPYLEGESLRDRLTREKQLPVDEAVRITTEVAAALSYAHSRGVIHRDIKPENILLTGGTAVVADFGIARALTAAGSGRLTETGLSLGTPQYMSPEQATADQDLDGRSDIYSLGSVLYEMLTGEPPYTGPTSQSVIAKVLTEEPRSVRLRRRTVPVHVEFAVHKALAKLPADRFTSAAEFSEALERPTANAQARAEWEAQRGGSPTGFRGWVSRNALVATLAMLATLGVGTAVWLGLRPAPQPTPAVVRFTIALPVDAQPGANSGSLVDISPDGTRLAYIGGGPTVAGTHLYVRAMDRLDIAQVPGTAEASGPSFSPDGRWVAFYTVPSSPRARRTLFKVSMAGGAAVTVCQSPHPISGIAWGDRDRIVFSTDSGGLYVVSASGGEPRAVLAPARGREVVVRPGAVLPGGKTVLATRVERGLSEIAAVDVATGRVEPLMAGASRASFAGQGYLVYQQGGTLMAAPFNAARRRVLGPATQLQEAVDDAAVSSATGAMVFANDLATPKNLVVVDRSGHVEVLPSGTRDFSRLAASPDGRRIAVQADAGIWIYDLPRRTFTRLAFGGAPEYPSWSPDGARVFFSMATADGGRHISWMPADGSAPAAVLLPLPGQQWESALTPDGRRIVYRENSDSTARDIYIAQLDNPAARRALAATTYQERAISLSPDGRWLAYVSDESGVDEVYVRPVDGPATRYLVSNGGGTEPRWARSGRELFFRARGDSLLVVSVASGPVFQPGPPRLALVFSAVRDPYHSNYDVFPDGRFVFIREAAGEAERTASFTVLLNEFDRLARERRKP